jgi:hypothetical protein
LQPFDGGLPQTDQQFQLTTVQLQRYGHISERASGNFAAALRGPMRQARPGAYFGQTQDQSFAEQQSSTQTYIGRTTPQEPAFSSSNWDAMLPQQPDPVAAWSSGGGQQAETRTMQTFMRRPGSSDNEQWGDADDCIDADASSDSGNEELGDPSVANVTDAEASEQFLWDYREAERNWCRFRGKPVRRFRRSGERVKFRQKGEGGELIRTHGDTLVYFKASGRRNRVFTAGERRVRRKNPKDCNGNVTLCRKCNSDGHFEARRPQGGEGSGKGTSGSSFSGRAVDAGQRDPNAASGSQPAEASSEVAPWSENDIAPPSSIFFQSIGEDAIGSSGEGQQAETGTTSFTQAEIDSDAALQTSSRRSSDCVSIPESFRRLARRNGVRFYSSI